MCDSDNLTYSISVTSYDADGLSSDSGTVTGMTPNFTVNVIVLEQVQI